MKKISILLSCFRGDDLISSYIESLLSEPITAIATLIVIDFPFSHRDPISVEKHIRRYPDLVLVQKDKNISLYDAWNEAIALAKTDFVANLNLDDRVDKTYYALAARSLSSHQADVFSSFSTMTSDVGKLSAGSTLQENIPLARFGRSNLLSYGLQDMVIVAGNRIMKRNIPHCAPVWRRSLHDELGGFDSQRFDFCADYAFWLQVAAANKTMILSKEALTLFFCANGTVSDRLIHRENEIVLDRWKSAWPPKNYTPTHLGERHDMLHFCLNMNAIFSSPLHHAHIGHPETIDSKLATVLNKERETLLMKNSTHAPALSVIIPIYNARPYLQKALKSVLDQGITDLEVLLIDDGSTDGSQELARSLAANDNRLRVLGNSRKKGVSGARNTGLQEARGQYIAFLDADDAYEAGALRARLSCLNRNSDVPLVHGPTRFVDEEDNDLSNTVVTPRTLTFADMHCNPAHLNSVMGRSAVLKEFRFDEEMTNGEDMLFLASVLRSGVHSQYVDGGGAIYRIHPGSTVTRDLARHEAQVAKVLDWVYSEAHSERIAPQHAGGILTPPKSVVLSWRRLSILASLILDNDFNSASRLLADYNFLAFVNSLQSPSILAVFRTPLARRHLISVEDATVRIPSKDRSAILQICTALQLASRAPVLFSTLASCLGFQALGSPLPAMPDPTPKPTQGVQTNTIPADGFFPAIAVVMGNGPSAKLVDFDLLRLGHVASVGMNAAYRHWDRIDFRPTFYICMDTVVIRSHAARIAELVEEGRINKFFLRDDFAEIFPHLARHPRIFWFSQARKVSRLFTTSFITTGSWAIRWMIFEGMKRVGTIGIDANYVELLPEARRLGDSTDLRLKITKTPTFNPNYFFSDYQQEGDQYNIPNNPKYLQDKGGLVHVDALRKVAEDIAKLGEKAVVTDCSPISNHEVFAKETLSNFLKRARLSLLTTFRSSESRLALENNVEILVKNCENPFLAGVHVFLEGSLRELFANLPESQADSLRAEMARGQLMIEEIASRPSYKQLFDYSNRCAPGTVALANSDIIISRDAASLLILGRSEERHPVYALTRWNQTRRGLYIQGMQSSPPWAETDLYLLTIAERNYFSFDTYIFETPLDAPSSLDSIMVGSYGCDTGIAAALKVTGMRVLNPCLTIQTVHVDEKAREYQGDRGKEDLVTNVRAVRSALLNRYTFRGTIGTSLKNLHQLSRDAAWLGGPKTMDIHHSIFRALGSTSWDELDSHPGFTFRTIAIHDGKLEEREGEILELVDEITQKNIFIEWELSGFTSPAHVCDLLLRDPRFREVGELLYHYQWQSSIHKDHATREAREIFSDLALVLRDVLNVESGPGSRALTASGCVNRPSLPHHVTAGPQFAPLGNARWLYRPNGASQTSFWHALVAHELDAGDGYVACVSLTSSFPVEVRLSVARHGDTPYEGSNVLASIAAGQKQEVFCKHIFKSAQPSFKVQLEVVSTEKAETEISIELLVLSQFIWTDNGVLLPGKVVVGPYSRPQAAHFEENDCISALLASGTADSVMVDVGAHTGGALAPFLDFGWKIFAFEPDDNNRAKLVERLKAHANGKRVKVDSRCVSNKSSSGASFYRSQQSTGISGMSAFHASHVEAQKVDTVTLAEFFDKQPLPSIDFLKIDTEGHDLFVLQGFPWERGKPAVIECEFEDSKTVPMGYTFHDLARFLLDKGYTVYVSEWHAIIRYGIGHDWCRLVRYPCELATTRNWGNLLAFRDPVDESKLVAAARKVLKIGSGPQGKSAVLPGVNGDLAASRNIPGGKPETTVPLPSGRRVYAVIADVHFTEVSTNQWRYTDSHAEQRLWLAVFKIKGSTLGRSFVAGIRLKSSQTMAISVSIGRYGDSEYEGANELLSLRAGVEQSVHICKQFAGRHDALKVQLAVLQLEGAATADLTIESVSITESLTSIRRRVDAGELHLSMANRLFREEDYSTALGLYLLLHQQRPLRMYPESALAAAHKLGMDSVQTVEELLLEVS